MNIFDEISSKFHIKIIACMSPNFEIHNIINGVKGISYDLHGIGLKILN